MSTLSLTSMLPYSGVPSLNTLKQVSTFIIYRVTKMILASGALSLQNIFFSTFFYQDREKLILADHLTNLNFLQIQQYL